MAMTKQQWIAMSSSVVAIGGGIAVGRGWINPAEVTQISGAIPAVVDAGYQIAAALAVVLPIIYGIWANLRKQQISAAAALPGATVVLDSQAEADKHPTASVVGPNDLVASTVKPTPPQ